MPSSEDDPPRPIVSTDSVPGEFVHEPWRGGDFILRLQPELLRGGQYSLVLTLDPAFSFPVAGLGMRAIQSVWGDERDGGRRSHEGVDIFARRGTPVLASIPGRVSRVRVTPRGGKVVWLRDEAQNRSLYYAHLDSQYVADGDWVEVGDTLGFVGNTGNARTTPPHLHFGVYYRGEGAVNPFPFLRPPARQLAEVDVDRARYGQWVRVRDEGILLRQGPSRGAEVVTELAAHTPARVLGGAGDWFRVALPDGTEGYLAARLTEDLTELEPIVAGVPLPVRAAPRVTAPRADVAQPGEILPVVGRFAGFVQVRSPSGILGWLPAPAAVLTDADQ